MKTKTFFGAAMMSCALLTAPAFAQDNLKDKAAEEVTDHLKDKAMKEGKHMAKDVMKDKTSKVMTSEDGMMIKGDTITPEPVIKAPMIENPVIEKPIMEAPTPTVIEIACPSGTTAQPDGTCMITGDYQE